MVGAVVRHEHSPTDHALRLGTLRAIRLRGLTPPHPNRPDLHTLTVPRPPKRTHNHPAVPRRGRGQSSGRQSHNRASGARGCTPATPPPPVELAGPGSPGAGPPSTDARSSGGGIEGSSGWAVRRGSALTCPFAWWSGEPVRSPGVEGVAGRLVGGGSWRRREVKLPLPPWGCHYLPCRHRGFDIATVQKVGGAADWL